MKVLLIQPSRSPCLRPLVETLLLVIQLLNGTATAGADYTATSGTLTISAGDTTVTFTCRRPRR